jgi:hypothetical protein
MGGQRVEAPGVLEDVEAAEPEPASEMSVPGEMSIPI